MGFFDSLNKTVSDLFGKKPKPQPQPQIQVNYSMNYEMGDRGVESKKLNDSCIRSRNGLTVGEILLLEYCKKGNYPNPQGGYQGFWWFDYGIKDAGAVLKTLENRGFIRYASPIERIETLKVAQLKEILKELDLQTTGKKSDLIERIKNSDNLSVLDGYFKDKKYTLTELGENELKENEYIPYMNSHKNLEMTVWDMNKQIHHTNLGYRNILWGNFNKQYMQYISQRQFGLARNVKLSMGNFLCEESKYKDALLCYAEVCYYDVVYYEGFSGYDDVSDLLLSGIITTMKGCKEKAKISNDELFNLMINHFSKLMVAGRKINISNQDLSGMIVSKIENS